MAPNYQPARGSLFRTRGLRSNFVSIFVVSPRVPTLKYTVTDDPGSKPDHIYNYRQGPYFGTMCECGSLGS
jgi:hypothetical protein